MLTVFGDWINSTSTNTIITIDSPLFGGKVVLGGNSQQYIRGSETIFDYLDLNGSGVKTMNVNTTVAGVLAIGNSTLELNKNILTVLNTATSAITSNGGYIESESTSGYTGTKPVYLGNPSVIVWNGQNMPKIFPFGVNGKSLPVTISSLSTNSASTFTFVISTRKSDIYNNDYDEPAENLDWNDGTNGANSPLYNRGQTGVIDRWWNMTVLTPTTVSTVTTSVIFSYASEENTITTAGNIGAQYWLNNSWNPNHIVLGSTSLSTNSVGTVSASNFTLATNQKIPFVLSSEAVALPIELIDFRGQCVNKEIVFDWCTASEKNNHYFTLEYSPDGINFSGIGRVYGNGTTGEKHCYQFIANALGELNYYRLKQTDYDGTTSYSKIIALKSCQENTNQIIIAHEGKKDIALIINSLSNQTFQLKLYNSLGQIIEETSIEIKEGYNNLPVNFENLSNAIYYVSIYNGVEKLVSKQIVVSDFNR